MRRHVKPILEEVTRINEMMLGYTPTRVNRLLSESGIPSPLLKYAISFFKTKGDDALLYLVKGGDEGFTKMMKGTAGISDDLSRTFPKMDDLLKSLKDGVDDALEVEAFLRVVAKSDYVDDFVAGLMKNNNLLLHWQKLFPLRKIDPKIIGKELGLSPDSALVKSIVRDLQPHLKKLYVKVPKIFGGKVIKITIGPLGRLTRWLVNLVLSAFKAGTGKKWLGFFIGTALWHGLSKWVYSTKWGAANLQPGGDPAAKRAEERVQNAFNPNYYLNLFDENWVTDSFIKENTTPDAVLDGWINRLKTAGIQKGRDFGVADDAIIGVYNDITYIVQMSQLADRYKDLNPGRNLETDIMESMDFPLDMMLVDFAALILAGTQDTKIGSVYEDILTKCEYQLNGECVREKDAGKQTNVKNKMYAHVPPYPFSLISDDDDSEWCGTIIGAHIHPDAWLAMTVDQPDRLQDNLWIELMDPETFNTLHYQAVPDMPAKIYVKQSELGVECDKNDREKISNYKEVFDNFYEWNLPETVNDALNEEKE